MWVFYTRRKSYTANLGWSKSLFHSMKIVNNKLDSKHWHPRVPDESIFKIPSEPRLPLDVEFKF